jgi:hypothetical protein
MSYSDMFYYGNLCKGSLGGWLRRFPKVRVEWLEKADSGQIYLFCKEGETGSSVAVLCVRGR